MKLSKIIIPIFLFTLTFIPRLYKIKNPIADWHSWRQSDTAAVARSLATEEFNLFYPRAHNYLPMNGLPNPERYFLNEFPFYNSIVAVIYRLVGVNEIYARLVSVFFASLGTIFLYYLVRNLTDEKTALISSIFYAILPFNIYYGRVVMPDPTFISLSIISLFLVSQWLKNDKTIILLLSGITWALAMLVKPYAGLIIIPVAYLILKQKGLKVFKNPAIYITLAIALIPISLWRYHINQYPEGMFGSGWLINQGDIRFKGAFFRWLIFERMNRLIFATGGFVLFIFGIVSKKEKKEAWFFIYWLIAVLAYMIYFARGNVTHDYYQLPLVPVGCVFMAKGFLSLFRKGSRFIEKLFNFGISIILILIMLAFGWYEVRGFFNINHPEIVEAGKTVDKLLPLDAKVIAPYSKDPAFLYQTNRNGWTDGPIEEWIQQGATHLVSVNFDDETNFYIDNCNVIKKTDKWVIIDLLTCRKVNPKENLITPPTIDDVSM